MSYLDQFTLKLGTCKSVTRHLESTTSGKIESTSAPIIIDGTSYGGGGGGGTITTSHALMEAGVIVSDDGGEYPYALQVEKPFMRDGSLCALMIRNGTVVSVTNLATDVRYWLNGGPEYDAPSKRSVALNLTAGLVAAFLTSLPESFVIKIAIALSAAWLVWCGVRNKKENTENEADKIAKRGLRAEMLDKFIKNQRAKAIE